MSNFQKNFEALVKLFSRFPGIGRRSAERMAFYILKISDDEVKHLIEKIENIRKFMHPCKMCNNFSTQDICSICADSNRDRETVCIVEEPKDVFAIEKTGKYKGLYYVLLGSVSPLEGEDGENLNIRKLINRLERGEIKEVIISTDADNDGELTSQFLIQKISPFKVKIYRLAIGIPLGTQIEYIDSATLGQALLDKKPIT